MLSIDQNCHSLWDVLPKLQALSLHGLQVQHCIEDVDVAFTSLGAHIDGSPLQLTPERFHRSGGADWGAALFYHEFLGRQPVEIRDWEPLTGMKTAALAHQLGRSVDDLYDEFSPSNNWQLTGPSYHHSKHLHRTIGDLDVSEAEPFLWMMLDRAQANMQKSFPSSASQQRMNRWLDDERASLRSILATCTSGRLVDVYRHWMERHLAGKTHLRLTSELFTCHPDNPQLDLLHCFTQDYDRLVDLYNEAIDETNVRLRPLRTQEGELPFFAFFQRDGHWLRTAVNLEGDNIRIDDKSFPLAKDRRLDLRALSDAGITSLTGKAILLVLQVRYGQTGQPLAVPYFGSLYMPAAHCLAEKLKQAGLLTTPLHPLMRVRFHLPRHLQTLDTPICLPDYLASVMGSEEVPARQLGHAWDDLIAQAKNRLQRFACDEERLAWQKATMPDVFARIETLDHRKREIAACDPKSPEIRQVWKEMKLAQTHLLDRLVRQIDVDTQVAELDYWDSRGALLPWCIALQGPELYNKLLQQAEIFEETGWENTAQ